MSTGTKIKWTDVEAARESANQPPRRKKVESRTVTPKQLPEAKQ